MRVRDLLKEVPVVPALLLTLLALGVLSGCGSTYSNDAPDRTPVLWSLPLPGGSQPSGISDSLIVSTVNMQEENKKKNGVLTFIDLDEREIIWQAEEGMGLIINQIMVSNGTNWFVNNDELRRVEVYQNDGTLVRTFDYILADGVNQSGLSPVIVDNALYISQGRGIYAFDISEPDKLTLLWSTELDYATSSLSADATGVYAGLFDHPESLDVVRLDAATGEVVWTASSYTDTVYEARTPASLALKDNALFVNTANTMQAFDTETGERLWLSEPLSCETDGPYPGYVQTLDDKDIYFTIGACVMSVSQKDGKINWIMSALDSSKRFTFSAQPLLHNGVLYTVNGYLWAIEADTGKVLSRSQKSDPSQFAYIHEYNNQIIVWGGNLLAYKPVR